MKSGCESKELSTKRSIELPVLANSTISSSGIKHSKTSRWRAVSLTLLTVLMIAHYIQWRITGTTVSPIEPSETMFTLQNGFINAGFIFFTLAILATLILGRFVCGWGCHIVALQDFCAWLLNKFGLKPRPFHSRLLVFCAADCCPLHVRMANCTSVVYSGLKPIFGSKESDNHSSIYKSFGYNRFLVNFSDICGRRSFSFHMRFYDRLFLGIKGFLHLRLPLRRCFCSC